MSENKSSRTLGTEEEVRSLWNDEYSNGQWEYLDAFQKDELTLPLVEKHACGGHILDVGCGTACNQQFNENSYSTYLGIDISDIAIGRAKLASPIAKAKFMAADMRSFEPPNGMTFSVILFRESLYYLDRNEILPQLKRFSSWLSAGGVILIRIWNEATFGIFDAQVSGRFPYEDLIRSADGGVAVVLRAIK